MKPNKRWVMTGLIALLVFVVIVLSLKMNANWVQTFDLTIQGFMTSIQDRLRTQVMGIITSFGSPMIAMGLTLLIAIAFWLRQERLLAGWIMAVQIMGDGVAFMIKELVKRPRPTSKLIPDAGYSFPSGHTFSNALLVLTILFIIVPLLEDQEVQLVTALLAIIWICALVFSRIYLRGHFATDVLGSVSLAIAWWEFSRIIYFEILKSKDNVSQKILRQGQR
ncbi:phosphatase PAP2 family protein [Paucilactobacillus nenjiangensis]|jgi:undecaprenyl-diphosphatase|uniref:Phosphatase PAP2 family protein n=1 Tax=Paucilactobacillus nenjiangensis TaxID=1296540 RepID=A0A5P1X2E8_9LACO|nr:phosphatase PAP2 family protein [Paucilactobacillus nenjiangensis]QER66508.1 phosphatase PAP2 family protein [Paucilactobacillus nenjiangensis]